MHSLRFLFLIVVSSIGGWTLQFLPDSGEPWRDEISHKPSAESFQTASSSPSKIQPAVEIVGGERPMDWKSFDEMHKTYTEAFVNSEGFGMSRLVTFDSPTERRLWVDGHEMRVRKVELIGLMSGTPVAYVNSWMNPLRENLDQYEQRSLTLEEQDAFRDLENNLPYAWKARDSQTASAEHRDSGRLIAALRAQTECVACHQVEEGSLLGAFVYTLEHATVTNEKLNALIQTAKIQSLPSTEQAIEEQAIE